MPSNIDNILNFGLVYFYKETAIINFYIMSLRYKYMNREDIKPHFFFKDGLWQAKVKTIADGSSRGHYVFTPSALLTMEGVYQWWKNRGDPRARITTQMMANWASFFRIGSEGWNPGYKNIHDYHKYHRWMIEHSYNQQHLGFKSIHRKYIYELLEQGDWCVISCNKRIMARIDCPDWYDQLEIANCQITTKDADEYRRKHGQRIQLPIEMKYVLRYFPNSSSPVSPIQYMEK